MNNIKNKTIAIVGGGPGGLTLARLLQLQSMKVTVYERDKHRDARAQGATLDLHYESGLLAIREAGLTKEFEASYRPGADKLVVTDKTAAVVWEEEQEQTIIERHRPEIDRGPLQSILLDSLQPGTVVWDSYITMLARHNEGWQLVFAGGATAYADIVIGADGANSKIRPFITPIRPFYSGIMVVEGMVYESAIATPRIHKLMNGGKIFALSDDKTLIVSSKGDGSLVFYTSMKTRENWVREKNIDFADRSQAQAWFKTEFAGWSDVWDELFRNAYAPLVIRPQYCMPLDQEWAAQPNITMLGDAAHLMPPFAGEGVNMAMLDAVELSRHLGDETYADTQAAIAAYEGQMLARASATAGDTLNATAILHSPGAIQYLVGLVS